MGRGEPPRAWLYQGRLDRADPALVKRFATQLHSAGADVRLGFFPGGHDWGIFRAQTPRMLVAAGRRFSHPPGRAGFVATGHSLAVAQLQHLHARRHRRRVQRAL